MEPDTAAQKRKKRLVLAVHGIGEQHPGDTLDRLVGASTGHIASPIRSDRRWLRDQIVGESSRVAKLFPCDIRRITTTDAELTFAEISWADISRGPSGKIATLYELIKGILGLAHVVRENAEEIHPDGHPLRTLSEWFVVALHGPIAVLNVLLGVGALLLFFVAQVTTESISIHITLAALGIVSGVAGFLLRKQSDSYLFAMFANWLLALGIMLVAGVACTTLLLSSDWIKFDPDTQDLSTYGQTRAWYVFVLVTPLNLTWVICLIATVGMIIGQALVNPRAERDDPRSIYPVVCAAMALLWLVATSIFWASLFKVMESLPHPGGINDVELRAGAGLMFSTWFSMLMVMAAALAAWLKWNKLSDDEPSTDTTPPRLILNLSVQRAFNASILLLAATALGLTYLDFFLQEKPPVWMTAFLIHGFSIALALAVAVGALYLVVWEEIAVGLALAKDVITYFKCDVKGQAPDERVFPLRARMHHRFHQVLEVMLKSERPDDVIILAHSQGTVLAIQALRGEECSQLLEEAGIGKPVLVTMGSPFSHIYHHYFGSKFSIPHELRAKLSQWINIYRIDDFVGTVIGEPQGDWPDNRHVAACGHTGYWADEHVHAILSEAVLKELGSEG